MSDLLSRVFVTFSRFSPTSALDILIVTIVFYGVLMLVRGTRADQVLRGVILLFIVFSVAASVFHLTMVDWLLHNSPVVLLVAIPIIFQPELRRALEQVGRTSALINHPFHTLATPLQPSTVDELIDGVERLADRKTGALIVLEGNTGLEDFAGSGVRLDAIVSSDLLVTVFTVPAPVHDGAAIIRGDRLLAAGCLLPLSDSPQAAGRGTRHRAALGITEQTDAACIVVSEETGAVSIARAGHLSTNVSMERLARYLDVFYKSHLQTGEARLMPTAGG